MNSSGLVEWSLSNLSICWNPCDLRPDKMKLQSLDCVRECMGNSTLRGSPPRPTTSSDFPPTQYRVQRRLRKKPKKCFKTEKQPI